MSEKQSVCPNCSRRTISIGTGSAVGAIGLVVKSGQFIICDNPDCDTWIIEADVGSRCTIGNIGVHIDRNGQLEDSCISDLVSKHRLNCCPNCGAQLEEVSSLRKNCVSNYIAVSGSAMICPQHKHVCIRGIVIGEHGSLIRNCLGSLYRIDKKGKPEFIGITNPLPTKVLV